MTSKRKISANDLAGIEGRFQDYVLGRHAEIDEEIDGASEAFRRERLGIYRDAYVLRLAEVLATDYEVLAEICKRQFDGIARAYIRAQPSVFRNVRWFGGGLAEFLRADSRYAARAVLAELAQFEWALGLAFDAPDTVSLPFEKLAGIPPDRWADVRFGLHPALRILQFSTNAVEIWQAITQRAAVPDDRPVPAMGWAIWRNGLAPHFRSLEPDEEWALDSVLGHASFGEVCAGLCDWHAQEAAAPRAASLLRGWVDQGWIVSITEGDLQP